MSIPGTEPSAGSATEVACDALVVAAAMGADGLELASSAREVDAATNGVLSGATEDGFKAGVGETFIMRSAGGVQARWVCLVGLGPYESVTSATLRRASAAAIRSLVGRDRILMALQPDDAESLEAAVEGALLGSYRFAGYKKEPALSKLEQIAFLGSDAASIERGRARAVATLQARDLINEPPSVLTPMEFARRAQATATKASLSCEVIEETELRQRGFGGILGTAAGSAEPPCLIVLRYDPADSVDDIALVGKGITFDSGGYSIKPAASMELMKTDMGGAAAVLGAMSALHLLGVRTKVTGYLACSENMVSGAAMRPGDVIHHYGGRTTEVVNTDAEGRLVLVDALELAHENGHTTIVDLATLTGSIHVALGSRVTGLFYNDEGLRDEFELAGEAAGEPMWRMPIVESYRSSLDSDVADMRNQGTRWGGASIAALFLAGSVGTTPWAHLDIAGTGRAGSDREEITKGGTGVGARTILHWLEARSAR